MKEIMAYFVAVLVVVGLIYVFANKKVDRVSIERDETNGSLIASFLTVDDCFLVAEGFVNEEPEGFIHSNCTERLLIVKDSAEIADRLVGSIAARQ